jgi:Transcription factor WhiB
VFEESHRQRPAADRLAWMDQAGCRGRGQVWFSSHPSNRALAIEGCRTCPVRAECESYTAEVEATTPIGSIGFGGVWAGVARGIDTMPRRIRGSASESA